MQAIAYNVWIKFFGGFGSSFTMENTFVDNINEDN
jgi:hypothetical protein